MRADHQAHVLEAQVAHRERAFEVRQRVRLVHAGVEQHEAVAGRAPPRRCSGERPARAAAGAGGRRPAAPARPARARACRAITSATRPQTRLRALSGGKGDGDGRAEESASRDGHEGAGGRRRTCSRRATRANAISASKARDRGAPLLRGDRRARPRRAPWRCGPTAAARTCAARSTCIAPEGVRDVHRRAARRAARTCTSRSSRRPPQDERCGVQWRLTRHVRRARGRSAASSPTGDPIVTRGLRPADRARRPDPVQRRLSPTRSRFAAPDRDDAAAGLGRRTAHDGRLQRQDAPDRAAVRAARPSWSPRACGSCRASPGAATCT